MNTWKIIFATLVIFVTGVVTGGLLVSYADRASQKNHSQHLREVARPLANNPNLNPPPNPRDPMRPLTQLPNRGPRGVSKEFLQRLNAEVLLTPGQRERIEQTIKEGQSRNKEIWDRVTPELRRELAETQRRIRELLTPEQRVRFEELMKQSRPRDQRRPLPPAKNESQADSAQQPPAGKP